ncbi:hypothetical protein UY3_01022 [Chelonia mydas]|uniref:Uncharacterized protein n=1 Tax=Chelonia mydas TaxID=8469 RepID=M7BV71_CHEMY|nr:hypothetical protein UY3_01022 [Chelonia mydas]
MGTAHMLARSSPTPEPGDAQRCAVSCGISVQFLTSRAPHLTDKPIVLISHRCKLSRNTEEPTAHGDTLRPGGISGRELSATSKALSVLLKKSVFTGDSETRRSQRYLLTWGGPRLVCLSVKPKRLVFPVFLLRDSVYTTVSPREANISLEGLCWKGDSGLQQQELEEGINPHPGHSLCLNSSDKLLKKPSMKPFHLTQNPPRTCALPSDRPPTAETEPPVERNAASAYQHRQLAVTTPHAMQGSISPFQSWEDCVGQNILQLHSDPDLDMLPEEEEERDGKRKE